MATSDNNAEELISRFCGSLSPADRAAFRVAAESALGAINCNGEGIAFRIIRDVWRGFFRPPPDGRTVTGPRHYRESKLQALPAVGADDPRTGARDRHRFQAV